MYSENIQVIYGGEGSNYTKARLLLESVLVLIYRNTHRTIERNFALPGLTKSHSTANMNTTFKTILDGMLEDGKLGPNEYERGRKSAHLIPDAISDGTGIIEAEGGKRMRITENGQLEAVEDVEMTGEGEEEGDAEQAGEAEGEDELTFDELSIEGLL